MENGIHTYVLYRPFVDIIPEGKTENKRIPLSEITGYRLGPSFYDLKIVDIRMNGVNRLLFVKRLTPADSKLHLYELHESGKNNETGESLYSYYLSLPGFGSLQTINTHATGVIPGFEDKMSAIVSDCPALAQKIKEKAKGYYIPFVSFDGRKHPTVLLKIISEYNNCH